MRKSGSCIDSVRFFESCYYNRLPVIVTDYEYYLFGEDTYNMDFCYRIHKKDINPKHVLEEMTKIYNTPLEDMRERANEGKKYFETIVREYFEDPTLYFLNWLEKKNETKK